MHCKDHTETHVDTREANFDCESKDERPGCDSEIDAMGQKANPIAWLTGWGMDNAYRQISEWIFLRSQSGC